MSASKPDGTWADSPPLGVGTTVSQWVRFQLTLWLLIALVYFGFDQGRATPDVPLLALLARAMVWSLAGLLVSMLLGWGHVRLRSDARSVPWIGALGLLGSLLGGLIWLQLFNLVDGAAGVEPGWQALSTWEREWLYEEWMDATLTLLIWHGVVFSLTQLRTANHERERALELRRANTEAQLIALRAQLDPHFLFNALNSAMALVHESPDGAETVLQRLADLLRRSLTRTDELTPMREEVSLVRDYLAIEQVRFEERLSVAWTVDAQTERNLVPTGILLPLVDNAVKHGQPGPDGRLCIELTLACTADRMSVSVANTGELSEDEHPRSLSVGLANVRARLSNRFGSAGTLELTEREGWVVASIEFPTTEETEDGRIQA